MHRKGNPPLVRFPSFSCAEIHPSVALSNDKGFRSLRRATNAARVGSAVAFEAKSDAKAFNGLRLVAVTNIPTNQNLKTVHFTIIFFDGAL